MRSHYLAEKKGALSQSAPAISREVAEWFGARGGQKREESMQIPEKKWLKEKELKSWEGESSIHYVIL